MRFKSLFTFLLLAVPVTGYAQSSNDDQVSTNFILSTNAKSLHGTLASVGGSGAIGNRSNGSVLGVDSLPNWSGSFYNPGQDSFGNTQFAWQYTMAGNSPFTRSQDQGEDSDFQGSTTVIGAPVIAVSLDLRNADGTPRFVNGHRLFSDATQFVAPVLNSPVFAKTFYDSSEDPTQFADAVQRAEFYHKSSPDWHTLLRARTATPRTMVLLRGTYLFALNPDGTCCAFVLIDENAFVTALFPATATDTTTPIGAAENAGDIRTKDLSTFLFPNALLFSNGNPANCCIIGFHTYDVEPGSEANGNREKRYVLDFASWLSPGIFLDPTFADVAPLSHEVSEAFNDPFGNNATPWWLSPNGNCQNNLEVGDVIEGLPNAQFPISLHGMTYHVQNEAMLQWFADVTPSSAIDKAYSYPDTTVLTSASVSMKVGCKGPFVP
jgi:hypothetical protein